MASSTRRAIPTTTFACSSIFTGTSDGRPIFSGMRPAFRRYGVLQTTSNSICVRGAADSAFRRISASVSVKSPPKKYNMAEAAGFGGLRRYQRGPGTYTPVIGMTSLSLNYAHPQNPTSFGIYQGSYAAEPDVLPDGRLVFSLWRISSVRRVACRCRI